MTTIAIENETDWALENIIGISRPVVVLARDYDAGETVPFHQHQKSQLIYGVEGSMIVATHSGKWALIPSRAVWVPAHTRHSIRMRSRLQMRTAYLDHHPKIDRRECAVVSVSPLLRELILSLLDEPRLYASKSRGTYMAALILSELTFTKTLSPLHLPWPEDVHLRKLCEAMQRRPHIGDGMEYWASKLNMSTRSLARLFRAELKMSFQEWRNQLLLLEAQIRLSERQSSLHVARVLGYDSHAAFSAMFRRTLGMTPSDYIKGI